MTTLDRYIAKQYLTNILVLLLILFSFVVVIDVSLNLDRFVKTAKRLVDAETEGSPGFFRSAIATVLIIADLWWPRLLQLFNFLGGIVLIAAMGFTCSQLSRHREFIAMLAAGISLTRVARPLIAIALIVSAVQLANQELILPKIAPLLERDHNDAGQRSLETTSVPLTADGQGRLVRAASFDAESETMQGLYVMERDPAGRATRVITANDATWSGTGWTLTNGQAVNRGPSAATRPTPIDFIETGLGPTELKLNQYRSFRNAVSFAQASALLSRRDLLDAEQADRLERIRWGRLAVIATNLLSLIISLPFFITREPSNMVIQSLKCSPITITALMGGILGASAGIPGLPATVGVFVPVMLLATVAVATRSFMKT